MKPQIIKKKLLVVEMEKSIHYQIMLRFTNLGYEVLITNRGKKALILLKTEQPILVIMGTELPDIDGYSICSKMRKVSSVSIILTSSINLTANYFFGLCSGADDYIIKPFLIDELETRAKIVLCKRYKLQSFFENQNNSLNNEYLIINLKKNLLFKSDTLVSLTNLEVKLLSVLINNFNKPLSREFILQNLWGCIPPRFHDNRVVDVYISRLRKKLEKLPTKPDFLITKFNEGYFFQKSFQMKTFLP